MNHKTPHGAEGRREPAQSKLPWSRPTLTRLDASDAEAGTRAANDGAFTTS